MEHPENKVNMQGRVPEPQISPETQNQTQTPTEHPAPKDQEAANNENVNEKPVSSYSRNRDNGREEEKSR